MDTRHVTSLELSKKLKALGVKQESEFYWAKRKGEYYFLTDTNGDFEGNAHDEYFVPYKNMYSAFLASELGEMLPSRLNNGQSPRISIFDEDVQSSIHWRICYHNVDTDITGHIEFGNTLSEALGLMLVYLKENKLV